MKQWFKSLLFPSGVADFQPQTVNMTGKDSSQYTVLSSAHSNETVD